MDTPTKIYLFTDRYPYGRGETFVESELRTIARSGENIEITVIPARKATGKRELPDGIRLCMMLADAPTERKFRALAAAAGSSHLWELPFLSRRPKNGRQWRNALGGLYRAYLTWFTAARHRLFFEKADIFYAYWLDNTATGLSFVKSSLKGFDKPLVCRAHGYDVFEEERGVFFPARESAFKYINHIFPVSRAGTDYLKQRYPQFSEKIECLHLGVENHPCEPHDLSERHLRFVSCSNVIALKRLELTANLLKRYAILHPELNITWTHFGAGPLLDDVRAETFSGKPDNFTAVFEGAVPNAEILKRYETGEFDIFVSLSQSEGMPVSVIEAMSCCIPPLCTAAGGTSDAVDDEAGFLLPLKPSYEDFARGLRHILANYSTQSQMARDRQRNLFSAERNFTDFYRFLSSLKRH